MTFDMTAALRPDLPDPTAPWTASPPYSFVGGHNDGASVPYSGLAEAAVNILRREGDALAAYNLGGSPQGYEPLRRFVCDSLGVRASTPVEPGEVLIVSGSLQALDLINQAFLRPGDTVIIEQATYGGMVTRLQQAGVSWVGVELDDQGIVPEHLAEVLDGLSADGITPRYLYTIPTVQNPTGSVMPIERRRQILDLVRQYGVPIFEDDCYADLVWDGERPPTFRALDAADADGGGPGGGQVIYCGSFSKSIAPALRVGYIVADPPVIRQLLALKTDAGTGALEQLALAEYAPANFDGHVDRLTGALQVKCRAMREAVIRHFPDDVTVSQPKGGIYVWLTFPEGVDTTTLVEPAAAAGIEFNPGAGWSADPAWGQRHLRLCFGHPDTETIEAGVARLAGVYRGVEEHLRGKSR